MRLPGAHNLSNALAAVAAAHAVGVDLESACGALQSFVPPARRLQLIGRYGPEGRERGRPSPRQSAATGHGEPGIALYDDFAHHPTAIRATLKALLNDYPRVLAVFEPASNSMRSGAHLGRLAEALSGAAHTWLAPAGSLAWDPEAEFAGESHITVCADATDAARGAAAAAQPGDAVVFLSNSGASGAARLLATALSQR